MSFGSDMRKWSEKAKQGVDQVIRASLIDVTTRIVKRTPVGNPDLWVTKNSKGQYVDYLAYKGYPEGYIGGQARGNWFATINNPNAFYSAGSIDPDGSNTISNAGAMAADAPGNIFYLTNNLPYIFRLEYQGWSTQAPEGMVRVSVIEFNNALNKAISEL